MHTHTLGSISVFILTDYLGDAFEILPEQRPISLKVMSTLEFYKDRGRGRNRFPVVTFT